MPIQKILVVDDSKTEQMYISDILRKNGYQVTTADDADQAMASMVADKPDLVLLDVVMPGKNGFQLARSISRDPLYAQIPIIMCSSKGQETDRMWGLRQGAKDYITKPVNYESFANAIRQLGLFFSVIQVPATD